MSIDLELQIVNESLKTCLKTLNINVHTELGKRYKELLQVIETTLGDITVSNEGLLQKQELATGGNVYDTNDETKFKVGSPQGAGAGGSPGQWIKLINATSTYKHKINKINYYLDLPSVPAYMPMTTAYFIAIKQASFAFTGGLSPTNFTDIGTNCYIKKSPRIYSLAPGTGQTYAHAGVKLIGTPAGTAPPEALLINPQKIVIPFTPNKALQKGGFSIWGWQSPIAGIATETMSCTLEYTIQEGGTL